MYMEVFLSPFYFCLPFVERTHTQINPNLELINVSYLIQKTVEHMMNIEYKDVRLIVVFISVKQFLNNRLSSMLSFIMKTSWVFIISEK